MKIDLKILSLPPYISTAWSNISSLHVENIESEPILIVTLTNGSRIEIPRLSHKLLEEIFLAHVRYIELGQTPASKQRNVSFLPEQLPEGGGLPLKIGIEGIDGLGGGALQHNPDNSNAPDLPPEILKKIAAISKALTGEGNITFPKPEPHCNCLFCQVARAIGKGLNGEELIEKKEHEEPVSDEDLKFREWDIKQTADKVYTVINPFDQNEHYIVHLGEPLGCTCGKKNCEHIRAVLST
jgi:hypothetical protein